MTVRFRVCNCTDFYLEDGIVRTLLVKHYPSLAHLSKQPCNHWQKANLSLEEDT